MVDLTPVELRQFMDRLADVWGQIPIATPTIPPDRVLVVDRLGEQSIDYPVAGLTECVDCAHPVLLSTAAVTLVLSGEVLSLCQLCASILSDTGLLNEATYIGQIS